MTASLHTPLQAPPVEPYASGYLDTGDGHQIYWEQCGAASGVPMVFLHGGPGSGCSPRHRRFFDARLCRAVLFDQRGCGRSLPRGALQGNTSEALIADMESLRQHLGIDRWLVVGGSWGAGLAVAYAAAHPGACLGLVLRGVFLGQPSDLDWFFNGARQLLPDAWAALFPQALPVSGEGLLPWLHAGLHGGDADVALNTALAWEAWEASLSQRQAVTKRSAQMEVSDAALLIDKYRVQSHYLAHQCFWGDHSLLQRAQSLGALPALLLHGRLDWICQGRAAWDLHQHLPGSRLQWVPDSGHSPFEPAMEQALVQAIRHFATQGRFAHWEAVSNVQPGNP
nr:prolyl aminopeptidase [uncultured Albidiferax sp.]